MSDAVRPTILDVRGLSQPAKPPHDGALDIDAFSLRAGEFAAVLIERDGARPPLADLAMGLLEPQAGEVLFEGRSWASRSPDEQAAARHRIGRIYDGPGSSWISNLDLDENVTLPLRYHRGPLDAVALSRVEALCREVGCWPMPETRPVATARDLLKRLEWVRALLVEPALLLLERPLREMHGDTQAFFQLARAAAERGVAILWMTTGEREWHDVGAVASIRLRMRGGRLEKAENG